MSKLAKIDLKLLKEFVSELERSLNSADGIRIAAGDKNQYLIEMSKAAGLASGIMQEAILLIADIQASILAVQSPGAPAAKNTTTDLIDKLLGPLKGPSGGTSN